MSLYPEEEEPISTAAFADQRGVIPAAAWNRIIDSLRYLRPFAFNVREGEGFRHPWNIEPAWNAGEERWEANIEPGFVNGGETVIEIEAASAPPETLSRLGMVEPGSRSPKRFVPAWLSEEPPIPIGPMRKLGTDGSGGSFPEFFRALGVGDPPRTAIDLEALRITRTEEDRSGLRFLRAADLVLKVPRPATKTDWTIQTGPGWSFAQFEVGFTLPDRSPPTLTFRREYQPPRPSDPRGLLTGNYVGDAFDELLLANVFLLSPEGAREADPIDGSWIPHVRHFHFWNLTHRINQIRLPDRPENIRWPLGLAGGVGDVSITNLAADLNDQSNAVANFLGSREIAGAFYSSP